MAPGPNYQPRGRGDAALIAGVTPPRLALLAFGISLLVA